jgi:hypothetical protein
MSHESLSNRPVCHLFSVTLSPVFCHLFSVTCFQKKSNENQSSEHAHTLAGYVTVNNPQKSARVQVSSTELDRQVGMPHTRLWGVILTIARNLRSMSALPCRNNLNPSTGPAKRWRWIRGVYGFFSLCQWT